MATAFLSTDTLVSHPVRPASARRPFLDRYLIGIAVTLLVALVRWWLDPILGKTAAFAIFYIAIIFTAWYSGFWPALFAMALGSCLASYMFDDTRGEFVNVTFRNQIACVVYFSVSLYLAFLITWLTGDIARRKQVESDLRVSQLQLQVHQNELAHMSRLSIMGEMAAGLAHELNQPLHAAKNYARGSVRRLTKNRQADDEVMMALDHIALEVDRAAEIIRRVRGFVQKVGPQVSKLAVNDVIAEALTIIDIELKRTGATIVCELAPDLGPVMADSIQIEQVMINLARNGLEAMQDSPDWRRVLTIGTRQYDERTIEVFVSDRGKGISGDEKEKMFEAFFTTKPEGMGMGLAISRSIIQAHEGRLWLSANEGQGCTFHFTLPIASPD